MVFFRGRIYFISGVLLCFSYALIFIGRSIDRSVLLRYELWSDNSFYLDFCLFFDKISIMFIGVVLLISRSVLFYCKWYIDNEAYYNRFVYLVYFFILSMIFLIFIPNVIRIILGWDGLGLTSFLLVCYYQNNKSSSAGLLTALTNRIGDVFILLAISAILLEGSWYLFNYSSSCSLWASRAFIVIARITKRAQFPFCAWLPAAIAAPTPVSALVHSSTLVTAGVYLLIRSYNLIIENDFMLCILQMSSLITILLAGRRAMVCVDVKKVVALSTLSQLSLMMFRLSIKIPLLAFFHLVTHAIFKALLFLSVGAVIHINKNIQDIRILGRMWVRSPSRIAALVIANCSLSGLPFLRGFFSKDLILDMINESSIIVFLYILCFLGSILTGLYSMRISWLLIFSINNTFALCYYDLGAKWIIWWVKTWEKQGWFFHRKVTTTTEISWYVYPCGLHYCYASLIVGAIFLGSVLRAKIEELLVFRSSTNIQVFFIRILWICSLFFFISWGPNKANFISSSFLRELWYVESLSSQPACQYSLEFSKLLNKSLDKGWLELAGPQGLYKTLLKISNHNEKFQNKFFITCIGFYFALFVVIFLVIFFFFCLNNTLRKRSSLQLEIR